MYDRSNNLIMQIDVVTERDFAEAVELIKRAASKAQEGAVEREADRGDHDRDRHSVKGQETAKGARPKGTSGQLSECGNFPTYAYCRADRSKSQQTHPPIMFRCVLTQSRRSRHALLLLSSLYASRVIPFSAISELLKMIILSWNGAWT